MAQPAISQYLDPCLAVALLASAVLHAVALLGIGLFAPEAGNDPEKSLHMVEYRPQEAARKVERVAAQAASRAQEARGASTRSREALSPAASQRKRIRHPLPAPAQALRPRPARAAESVPKGPKLAPAQDPIKSVLTTEESSRNLSVVKADTSPPPGETEKTGRDRSFQLYPSDRQLARWSRKQRERKVKAEESGPTRKGTFRDATAAYITSWLSKVQRIGSMNYPEEARQRGLTGRVRVATRIRPDGSVADVEILESSGSDLLDAGAKQIIRLAAPFSPFPEGVKAGHPEGLTIRHFFHFTKTGEGISSARSG